MQMMPKISWPQRVASDANGRAEMLVAAVIIGLLPFSVGRFAFLPKASDVARGIDAVQPEVIN
jgi:hypothetical protein